MTMVTCFLILGLVFSSASAKSLEFRKRRSLRDTHHCKLYMVVGDKNADHYMDANGEYIAWLNKMTLPTPAYTEATFDTLPQELQELYTKYANTYSNTNEIDIQGARDGTTPTSPEQRASLDTLCTEADAILSQLPPGTTAPVAATQAAVASAAPGVAASRVATTTPVSRAGGTAAAITHVPGAAGSVAGSAAPTTHTPRASGLATGTLAPTTPVPALVGVAAGSVSRTTTPVPGATGLASPVASVAPKAHVPGAAGLAGTMAPAMPVPAVVTVAPTTPIPVVAGTVAPPTEPPTPKVFRPRDATPQLTIHSAFVAKFIAPFGTTAANLPEATRNALEAEYTKYIQTYVPPMVDKLNEGLHGADTGAAAAPLAAGTEASISAAQLSPQARRLYLRRQLQTAAPLTTPSGATSTATPATAMPTLGVDTTMDTGPRSNSLVQDSPRNILLEDFTCPPSKDNANNHACLSVYGVYEVLVAAGQSRQVLYDDLLTETQLGITTGNLQSIVNSDNPGSGIQVLGAGSVTDPFPPSKAPVAATTAAPMVTDEAKGSVVVPAVALAVLVIIICLGGFVAYRKGWCCGGGDGGGGKDGDDGGGKSGDDGNGKKWCQIITIIVIVCVIATAALFATGVIPF